MKRMQGRRRIMKEKMNKIPVFYACDDNFVKYTMVSLQSMMDHASKEAQYEIHVLHTNISEEMQKKMHAMENANFSVQFDHVTEYLHSIQEKLPLRDYYSKTTYFRLFIAEMFPEIDKAIYIDSDTIVLGDIAQLYAYDLGDAYVGACREQVMIQEDVYGTYVEKVLGVERDNYFNAGMLVINCEQFRKNHVLEQFMELLPMYNFVVTQDEDYLNLICHNKVCWLPQKWNVEVFGQIPCREEEICVLHYIMVSKPWHYSDCRLQEYFWESAEKSSVYAEIRQVLESYTDEERKRDAVSCDRLMQTAKDEIAKENNYLNLVKAGKLKSKDRLEVLEKIALYEREGRFGEDVEEDPPTRELQPSEIDYLRKKLKSRIKTRLTYKVARTFLNKIIENKQLIIKDVIGTEHMDALTSGAVITCNHFNAFDSFAMQIAYEKSKQCKKRRLYRVIREGNYTNFPGFYGMLMRNCYTFPLSSNRETMKKFLSSMDTVLQHGDFMLVYPEQSMWWNYRKPKPLKKGAYTFAAKNHVPVLPCFITMEDSDILGDEDHLGDMDFKVTGTKDGITATQMDIKVDGLSYEILEKALLQAKEGREYILGKITECIAEPREDLKPHAPRIETMTIPKEFIGAVIGPGGKIIQGMQEETGATITIEEVDNIGRIEIAGTNKKSIDDAMRIIKGIVAVPEVGEVYKGKVRSIMPYGAFVEFLPGKDGLLHISEIDWKRLETVEEAGIKEGDEIDVKLLDIDPKTGKFKLSRKVLLPRPERQERPEKK